MKKVLVSSVLVGVLVSVGTTFAQTTEVVVPTTPEVTSVISVSETAAVTTSNNLAWIKARGAFLIRERVNSLNANAQAVAASKNLTANQKTAFAAFFVDEIGKINLRGQAIASSTDATSTKALVTGIFVDFRIYAIVIPQIRLEKRIYELQNHALKLTTDTFVKIQTAIDTQKAAGKDVTVWQKNLDDAKTLVASDTPKLSSLLIQIGSLKPSDYGTTSKTTIESVNIGVRAVARDFQSINWKIKRPTALRRLMLNTTSNASTTLSGTSTAVTTP